EATGLMNANPTGISFYIKNLLLNLMDINADVKLYCKISRYKNRHNLLKHINAKINWHYNHLYNPLKKVDIAHTTDSAFLNLRAAAKIYTIYDLAVFREETQIPDYTSERHKRIIDQKTKAILKKADGVIAISTATKNDILRFYDFPENKIRVIPLAPNQIADSAKKEIDLKFHQLEKNAYFLFVGQISIRKNIINLLKAFLLSGLHSDFKLVLAGMEGRGIEIIKEAILELGLNERVELLNYIPDESLSSLYENAVGFVFPTFYEGFGIPILEAMMNRTPVLSGNIGASPETAGGFAVEVSPFSVDEISEGLKNLLAIPKDKIENAFNYANNFNWQNNAIETHKFYEETLNSL
ncbi:MAG: glycosyltransferase family 4 protein, partial [Candidatus Marinimicrobia bacterium]|nr:glycosyltransferase family 4 protein [Candidatus Neomarinimicrobiota bacterium]